jgi:hypothetical protein
LDPNLVHPHNIIKDENVQVFLVRVIVYYVERGKVVSRKREVERV